MVFDPVERCGNVGHSWPAMSNTKLTGGPRAGAKRCPWHVRVERRVRPRMLTSLEETLNAHVGSFADKRCGRIHFCTALRAGTTTIESSDGLSPTSITQIVSTSGTTSMRTPTDSRKRRDGLRRSQYAAAI